MSDKFLEGLSTLKRTDKGDLEVVLGSIKLALTAIKDATNKLNDMTRTCATQDASHIDDVRTKLFAAVPLLRTEKLNVLELIDTVEDREQ